jgi:hypothetical protein
MVLIESAARFQELRSAFERTSCPLSPQDGFGSQERSACGQFTFGLCRFGCDPNDDHVWHADFVQGRILRSMTIERRIPGPALPETTARNLSGLDVLPVVAVKSH